MTLNISTYFNGCQVMTYFEYYITISFVSSKIEVEEIKI